MFKRTISRLRRVDGLKDSPWLVVLDTESEQEYLAMVEDHQRRLQPSSGFELDEVYYLAGIQWRILRYRRMEASLLERARKRQSETLPEGVSAETLDNLIAADGINQSPAMQFLRTSLRRLPKHYESIRRMYMERKRRKSLAQAA
jgi:hypothetical protein